MKKILYILNTGLYSGAENVVIQIINNLDRNRYKGIYAAPEGEIREILNKQGIEYEPMDALNTQNLRRVIDKVNPDLIHANDYTAVCVSAICRPQIPMIAHLHNNSTWIKKVNFKTLIFAVCVARFQKVVTVSESIADEYVFSFLIKHKTECIGNPVDIGMIRSKMTEHPDKEYDIIVLGRLSEAKNPFLALEIIKDISKQQAIRVVFVGDGELRKEVENKIDELELTTVVEMMGFRSNPYEYLAKSKVMLMPSKWEGYGLAAVEGLAYGIPVVASDAGGLPGIVNVNCGKICKEKSDYVKEISKLLTDPIYWQRKSDGAIKRSDELENIKEYYSRINQLYEEMLR